MRSTNNFKSYSVLAILLTIALFVLSWKLIVPGYTANKTAIASVDEEINQLSAKKEALDKARSDLSSIESAYKQITVSVSEDADEANIMSEIEAIALKSGLTVPGIDIVQDAAQPTEDTAAVDATAASGQAVIISISVAGKFDQLSSFVASLEKSVKFMNISSVTYSKGEEDILNLSLSIKAYSRTVVSDTSETAAQ